MFNWAAQLDEKRCQWWSDVSVSLIFSSLFKISKKGGLWFMSGAQHCSVSLKENIDRQNEYSCVLPQIIRMVVHRHLMTKQLQKTTMHSSKTNITDIFAEVWSFVTNILMIIKVCISISYSSRNISSTVLISVNNLLPMFTSTWNNLIRFLQKNSSAIYT